MLIDRGVLDDSGEDSPVSQPRPSPLTAPSSQTTPIDTASTAAPIRTRERHVPVTACAVASMTGTPITTAGILMAAARPTSRAAGSHRPVSATATATAVMPASRRSRCGLEMPWASVNGEATATHSAAAGSRPVARARRTTP